MLINFDSTSFAHIFSRRIRNSNLVHGDKESERIHFYSVPQTKERIREYSRVIERVDKVRVSFFKYCTLII